MVDPRGYSGSIATRRRKVVVNPANAIGYSGRRPSPFVPSWRLVRFRVQTRAG